jgi:hypothetical protein
VFPSYERGSENFIWPIGEFFNRTREMLIASGFREQISLQIGDKSPFVAHSPVFYDGDHLVRLQIIFASPRGNFLSCILTSFMKSGDSVVTSNLNAIFTSFLPKSWHALRRPMASLDTLIRVHRKRIAKMDIKKFGRGDILQAINGELAELEKKNCELGFCERVGGNSHATLTFEGRYHLWSEMLQCAYFGKIF